MLLQFRYLKPGILFLFTTLLLVNCKSQGNTKYPKGTTIDPKIEKACKKVKKINSLKVDRFLNDSLIINPAEGLLSAFPLMAVVNIQDGDTNVLIMNMMSASGIRLKINREQDNVEYFVSSRSCQCYKSRKEDSEYGYGAVVHPKEYTLVLSRNRGIKTGDKIYGYIKTAGGEYYSQVSGKEDNRNRMEYEGYFVVDFKPVGL